MLHRPGTYVHPQTEIVVVVDDGATIDAETLVGGRGEGEWVLVSDELPIDEHRRDELVEALARRAAAPGTADDADLDVDAEEDVDDDADELDEHGFSTGDLEDDDEY